MDAKAYLKHRKQDRVSGRNQTIFKRFVIVEKTKKFPGQAGQIIHAIKMSLGF